MTKKKKISVLLCGGSFSGNLGAQAMYDSIIDELRNYLPDITVSVLSKYPEDDEAGCSVREYQLIPYPTTKQLVSGGLFYVFGGLFKLLHLPYRWMARGSLSAYFDNDILIDASGISFTDDRSFVNVMINTLWFLPAVISNIPIFKVSQTMGPYKKWYVRLFASIALKHVDYIVCRGNLSYKYTVDYLKKERIYNLPDTAICLKPEKDEITTKILDKYNLLPNEYIAIGPSFVMRDFLQPGAYAQIVADTINLLGEKTDLKFVLVPHSWKHTERVGVDAINDDYSVCLEIKKLVDSEIECIVMDEEVSARGFKSLIGNAYMTIGSRYHFLIAALSSGVPSMALGWSHKYKELFEEFGIENYVLEYQNISFERVSNMALALLNDRDELYKIIDAHLLGVKSRSAQNEELIIECMKNMGIM